MWRFHRWFSHRVHLHPAQNLAIFDNAIIYAHSTYLVELIILSVPLLVSKPKIIYFTGIAELLAAISVIYWWVDLFNSTRTTYFSAIDPKFAFGRTF